MYGPSPLVLLSVWAHLRSSVPPQPGRELAIGRLTVLETMARARPISLAEKDQPGEEPGARHSRGRENGR